MHQTEEAMIQNLKDAGCDGQSIEGFLKKLGQGGKAEGMHMLELHRCSLLEALHMDQKKIDCLDYLIYQLKKEENVL